MMRPPERPITAEDCRSRRTEPSPEYLEDEAKIFAPMIGKVVEIMERHGLIPKAEGEGRLSGSTDEMLKWKIRVSTSSRLDDPSYAFELYSPKGTFLGWGTLLQCINCVMVRTRQGVECME